MTIFTKDQISTLFLSKTAWKRILNLLYSSLLLKFSAILNGVDSNNIWLIGKSSWLNSEFSVRNLLWTFQEFIILTKHCNFYCFVTSMLVRITFFQACWIIHSLTQYVVYLPLSSNLNYLQSLLLLCWLFNLNAFPFIFGIDIRICFFQGKTSNLQLLL